MSIESIIDEILIVEGDEYTNDPHDSGGPTKYGITQRTLSKYLGRPASAMEVKALTADVARKIYRRMYVDDPGFGLVAGKSELVAEELVDTGVNCGQGRAAEWFQRCLNVLNNRAKHYADIGVDGDIGPATLAAFDAFLRKREDEGEIVMVAMLNSLQGGHYVRLAERREKDERFVYGWFKNRVVA